MLELKARFTFALIFTTCPTLGRGRQEVSLPEGAGEGRGQDWQGTVTPTVSPTPPCKPARQGPYPVPQVGKRRLREVSWFHSHSRHLPFFPCCPGPVKAECLLLSEPHSLLRWCSCPPSPSGSSPSGEHPPHTANLCSKLCREGTGVLLCLQGVGLKPGSWAH